MINWELIGKISSVTGIISFILGLNFSKLRRKLEYNRIKKISSKMANKKISGVLIISIGNNCIENQVKNWLRDREGYRDIPNERIFVIEKSGDISKDNIPSIVDDIRKTKLKIQLKGITCVHLFIAAPLVVAEFVGAEFDNNIKTYMYQYNVREKEMYECWGELQK